MEEKMAEKILTQCTVGGAVWVHVKDGRISKIRPIIFDETDAPSWTIEARGKVFKPPRQTTLNPFIVTYKSRVYSDKRINYPYKRKDFDPNGARNPQNRGKSGYERISWDEALDIVASEIKRIRKTYGPAAITGSTSSHADFGLLNYKMGPFGRFWQQLGFTFLMDNPDSWEGWLWGAAHAWGYYWKLGVSDNFDMLEDALKHTEQIIFWGVDPNTSAGGYNGQESNGGVCGVKSWESSLSSSTRGATSPQPRGETNGLRPGRGRMPPWRKPSRMSGSKRGRMTNGLLKTGPWDSRSSKSRC